MTNDIGMTEVMIGSKIYDDSLLLNSYYPFKKSVPIA